MRQKYIEKSVTESTQLTIAKAARIIDDYQSRGYDLTLRQLYYQLVAAGEIANKQSEYNKLGRAISTARLVGAIDWDAIVDRTRKLTRNVYWSDPAHLLKEAAKQYRIDKWQEQTYRVFVWVEKEALAGVVAHACQADDTQVDFLSCRGYMSQSTIWREGRRLLQESQAGRIPVVLHLGDHDPSGIDMTRDNASRLSLFSGLEMVNANNPDSHTSVSGKYFIIKRIALNIDQVVAYQLPPNPAKLSDSRASQYVTEHGHNSWELDALDPDILVDLILGEIETYLDRDTFEAYAEIEAEEQKKLLAIADDMSN